MTPRRRSSVTSNKTTPASCSAISPRIAGRAFSRVCRRPIAPRLQARWPSVRGCAGRLMQRDFVATPVFWSVGQGIDLMRTVGDNALPQTIFEIYSVEPGFRLPGAAPAPTFLRSPPGAPAPRPDSLQRPPHDRNGPGKRSGGSRRSAQGGDRADQWLIKRLERGSGVNDAVPEPDD